MTIQVESPPTKADEAATHASEPEVQKGNHVNSSERQQDSSTDQKDERIIPTDPKIKYALLPVQQTITTKRLRLRPVELDDAKFFWGHRSRIEIMQWSSRRPATSMEEVDDWVRMLLSTHSQRLTFAVELLTDHDHYHDVKEPPVVIGHVGIVHFPPTEVGYSLHPDYWRKGFATEMINAFMKLYWINWPSGIEVTRFADDSVAFGPPNEERESTEEKKASAEESEGEKTVLRHVCATVDHANVPSWKLLEKLGWKRVEENHEQEWINPNWGDGDTKRMTYVYRLDQPTPSP